MNDIIKDLMKKYNRAFYLYEEATIKEQIDKLKSHFSEFEFLYSVKTNPNKNILNFVSKNDIGADAASANEVFRAINANIPKEKIIYSAPGKTKEDIEKTYDKCIITADSYNELKILNEVAKENNTILKVGIRINPNYSINGEKGAPSKFGIDEESLIYHKEYLDSLKNIKICGIHVHIRSQVLDYEMLYNYYSYVFNLAVYCIDTLGFEMDYLNFGGGLGIAYSENEDELNIDLLGEKCRELINTFKKKLNCRLIIESGRFIVCKSGTYATYIIDKKYSRGNVYIVTANGYNGLFKPTVAQMIASFGVENPPSVEPLFTSLDSYKIDILNLNKANGEKEIATVGGNLCTAADLFGVDLELPKAEIGDIVTVSNVGSYACTLTPVLFSSHKPPLEIYLKQNGEEIEDEIEIFK